MEKRSLALISRAEPLLGFGVFTCWRSYFFYYCWPASRNKSSCAGEIWFNSATELSGCSLYSDADHPGILTQWAESVYPWQPIYVNAHQVFLRMLCWKAWCAVSVGRTQGFSPCGRCLDERWEEPALHSVLWKSQTRSPVTWSGAGRRVKHVEAGGEGGRAASVGLPLLPPGRRLPGSSSSAKK